MSQQQPRRQRGPGGLSAEMILLSVVLFAGVVAVGVIVATLHLGHRISNTDETVPADPFEAVGRVFTGDVTWPPSWPWVLAGVLTVLLTAVTAVAIVVWRWRRSRTRVDSAAEHMGRGRDLAALTAKGASAAAQRLGVSGSPGRPLGKTMTGQVLFSGWEDMGIHIWGPRTGKTTSQAIPAILDAPGAVLVTSNKRDVVDATRGPRREHGDVWVFDPQNVAGEEPSWWWNPLSYVTDEVKAARLAEHFASGSRPVGARTDAFFDPAGRDLLAGLLLAAALSKRPITDVYTWLTRPDDDTPVEILTDHSYTLTADQVSGVINAPEKQRGGIYGTAQQMATCLTNRAVARWVTPARTWDQRPQFDPHSFVRTGGTLFSLSREGQGTAGPLVTALTVATVEAAEELAAKSPGGRLQTPIVGILDEAANVCRWKDLPDLYSHYGSRGIVLDTILQSWSQGVEVWGREGMRKLWSASNIKTYGGGVSETEFLNELSQLIGDHDVESSSLSYGRGHRTVSRQLRRERILDVADLGALPRGRAVLIASGAPPSLIRTVPWMVGPHASAVRKSIAAHDPQAGQTLTDADQTMTLVTPPTDGR